MLAKREDRTFLIIVAAPSIGEAHRVASAAGIPLPNEHIRHVRNAHGLRGWTPGTPVLCGSRKHWPADFDDCLMAMIARGHLRIAQDADIKKTKGE